MSHEAVGALRRARSRTQRNPDAVCALEIVVDALALERVLAQEVLGDHADLGVRHAVAAGILAGHAAVRLDREHVPGRWQTAAGLVHMVEAVVIDAEVVQLPAILMDPETGDAQLSCQSVLTDERPCRPRSHYPRTGAHRHVRGRPVLTAALQVLVSCSGPLTTRGCRLQQDARRAALGSRLPAWGKLLVVRYTNRRHLAREPAHAHA